MRFPPPSRLLVLAVLAAAAGAAELTVVAPVRSYLSPVCIEGATPGERLPTVRRYGVVPSPVRLLGPRAWYSDLRLLPDLPAAITVSLDDRQLERTVTWASADVDGPPLALTARVGDVIAVRTAGEVMELESPSGRVLAQRAPAGFPRPHTLARPGVYRFRPPGGSGGVTVTVRALPVRPDADQPVALLADNRTRRFPLPAGSEGLACSSADPDLVVARVGEAVDLRVRTPGTHLGAVRLGTPTGPILGTVPVVGYRVDASQALEPLPVAADGTVAEAGTLTVIGDRVSPRRFRARIVLTPWVPNLKLTFTKFAHPAYFLGGATTFTVLSDGSPTSLGEPGFVVGEAADGTPTGTFDYSIFSPAGNRSQCVRIEYRTLFAGAPAALAWLAERVVTP